MKQFENIPQVGLTSTSNTDAQALGIITRRMSGMMVFTQFSIMQIIAGAEQLVRENANLKIDVAIVNILSKLFRVGINMEQLIARKSKVVDIATQVTREEVICMLSLLEARMRHCEEERDQRKPSFNPDTYIGQKLMLIELRDWLSVSLVSIKEEQGEPTNLPDAVVPMNMSLLDGSQPQVSEICTGCGHPNEQCECPDEIDWNIQPDKYDNPDSPFYMPR